jgi:hypothetical protein
MRYFELPFVLMFGTQQVPLILGNAACGDKEADSQAMFCMAKILNDKLVPAVTLTTKTLLRRLIHKFNHCTFYS